MGLLQHWSYKFLMMKPLKPRKVAGKKLYIRDEPPTASLPQSLQNERFHYKLNPDCYDIATPAERQLDKLMKEDDKTCAQKLEMVLFSCFHRRKEYWDILRDNSSRIPVKIPFNYETYYLSKFESRNSPYFFTSAQKN